MDPHSRSTESENLGVGQVLQVILMHSQVWEPLYWRYKTRLLTSSGTYKTSQVSNELVSLADTLDRKVRDLVSKLRPDIDIKFDFKIL